MDRPHRRIAGAACALIFALAAPAQADQQQWASTYVNWTVGESARPITSIDQNLWVVAPGDDYQWVLQFSWTADPAHGGYLGFNRDAQGNSQMIYSLWNATAADAGPDAKCVAFDGEGSGLSCRQPFELRADRWYRLRLERTTGPGNGTWWAASISEEQPSGPSTTVYLGKLAVDRALDSIVADSVSNFIEYYGEAVPECGQVGVSGFHVTPPQLNGTAAAGDYLHTAEFAAVSSADRCRAPTDPIGASSVGSPVPVSSAAWARLYRAPPPATGVMVFLGGGVSEGTLQDAYRDAAPTPPPGTRVRWAVNDNAK